MTVARATGSTEALSLFRGGFYGPVIGGGRKPLIFPLDQIPELTCGAGVILQRYKDGGMSDARVFAIADGLTWRLGEKTRTETNLRDWIGERGQAGRMPPNGFPKPNRFD